MEVTEAVAALTTVLDASPWCDDKKNPNPGWKVVIHDIKQGVGDPEVLRQNLVKAGTKEPAKPPALDDGWHLFKCGPSTYPFQSHHLIPEKQLPDHPVTVWLTDSPKKEHDEYVLSSDTPYDTNGAKNGYFMPFAATTHQWVNASTPARRAALCFEMMRLTTIQLHQGPHSFKDYAKDKGEVLDIETPGYKAQVKDFLDLIASRTANHVKKCEVCKSQASPKIKVQPLEATVHHMNEASGLLRQLVDSWRIFVSERAFNYFVAHQKKRQIVHPSTPLATP